MANSSHYKAHYRGYLYRAGGVVHELGVCLLNGLRSRYQAFSTRPKYYSLVHRNRALGKLTKKPVMITSPHP